MSLFISDAMAAGAAEGAQAGGAGFGPFVMLAIFFAVFYFLILRPQSKRAKAHKELISSITVEDEVVTNGGLLGKVVKLHEQFVVLSIAGDVEVKMQRSSIQTTLPKGTMGSF